MSRIEEIDGRRWAVRTAQEIMGIASTKGGVPEIIEVVQRGTVGNKPEDYKKAVRKFIEELEIAASIMGLRGKT